MQQLIHFSYIYIKKKKKDNKKANSTKTQVTVQCILGQNVFLCIKPQEQVLHKYMFRMCVVYEPVHVPNHRSVVSHFFQNQPLKNKKLRSHGSFLGLSAG